jgi:hypothetical protein
MGADRSSDHGSSSDEGVGSDSSSVCVHSAGPPPVTDVVIQCHRSPLEWGVEGERQLQRIATRGGRQRQGNMNHEFDISQSVLM